MFRRAPLSLALLVALLTVGQSAEATVVERIVAVIGDKAVLLSDLRERAEPFLAQVHQSVPAGAQRNAAISQLYRTMLGRIVDEELELRAAQQSKLSVSAKEIDDALERVATQNKISVSELLTEAERTGLSAAAYRDELRRQLLEAKLINLRLQGRIRVTEEDLRTAYRKLVIEERQRLDVTPAWIVIPAGSSPPEQRKQRALADSIAVQARTADFGELARRFSIDESSREQGGMLRSMKPTELPPNVGRVTLGLDIGDTSPAVRLGDNYVVLKIVAREDSGIPNYEQAQRELAERVYMDKMAQAKKLWLDGLRRQHHVEIRL